MELFNEFYASELQFRLAVFAQNRNFTLDDACKLAKRTHIFLTRDDLAASVAELLGKYVQNGFLSYDRENDVYRTKAQPERGAPGFASFAPAMNIIEENYLSDAIRNQPFEAFFGELPAPLSELERSDSYDFLGRVTPEHADSKAPRIDVILRAIYEKRTISYTFCTNSDRNPTLCTAVPYRLEYSAFDRRWWLILYDIARRDTVKARLENLSKLRLSDRHEISDEEICRAITSHLSSGYATLRVKNGLNAFERCFIMFENMTDISSKILNENEAELRFRYFDWDIGLIVKKLLFLGKNVTLTSPREIVGMVIERLSEACDESE